jgi:hypothetical protein
MRTTSGTDRFTALQAVITPVGDGVALHDAAEDVDQDALDLGFLSMILKASVTFSAWRRRPRPGSWPARRRTA